MTLENKIKARKRAVTAGLIALFSGIIALFVKFNFIEIGNETVESVFLHLPFILLAYAFFEAARDGEATYAYELQEREVLASAKSHLETHFLKILFHENATKPEIVEMVPYFFKIIQSQKVEDVKKYLSLLEELYEFLEQENSETV